MSNHEDSQIIQVTALSDASNGKLGSGNDADPNIYFESCGSTFGCIPLIDYEPRSHGSKKALYCIDMEKASMFRLSALKKKAAMTRLNEVGLVLTEGAIGAAIVYTAATTVLASSPVVKPLLDYWVEGDLASVSITAAAASVMGLVGGGFIVKYIDDNQYKADPLAAGDAANGMNAAISGKELKYKNAQMFYLAKNSLIKYLVPLK
jgi:hypothetical protein